MDDTERKAEACDTPDGGRGLMPRREFLSGTAKVMAGAAAPLL